MSQEKPPATGDKKPDEGTNPETATTNPTLDDDVGEGDKVIFVPRIWNKKLGRYIYPKRSRVFRLVIRAGRKTHADKTRKTRAARKPRATRKPRAARKLRASRKPDAPKEP